MDLGYHRTLGDYAGDLLNQGSCKFSKDGGFYRYGNDRTGENY